MYLLNRLFPYLELIFRKHKNIFSQATELYYNYNKKIQRIFTYL